MINNILKSSITFALLSSLVMFSGCGIDNDGENTVGNNFISAEVIEDINASSMLPFAQAVAASLGETRDYSFGFKSVKILYNTKDMHGNDIVASGLLIIPSATDEYQEERKDNGEPPYSVSMINENHGTIFTDAEAPTNSIVLLDSPEMTANEQLYATMVSYAGFAAVIPDYIGYGASKDTAHPYMLKEASARASLDMIRASVRYMTDTSVAFNTQLYISGYSQGGHTAMALTQEIEETANSEFNLMGVASMAAPHDLEALGDIELDASHTMIYPAFLGYLADSYAYYNEDISLSDLVLEENTTMYHSLFGGDYINVEIHGALGLTENYGFTTYTADHLFKISLLDDYQNDVNTGAIFRDKFIENSTYDWAPKTKVNLIHCQEDEIIPYTMSQKAYDTFDEKGSENVTLSLIPSSMIPEASLEDPFVHSRCATTAYGAAVT